jgi:disulfide bond formation protein DsbB
MNLQSFFKKYVLYLAFGQSLIATLGSLTFSEILHFPPCVLCWYQRIVMYPLVLVFGIAILKRDKLVEYYAWPMIAIGWLISVYHNLLYYNILPEAAAPCIQGVSCTTKFIEWFGFITIPFLSLTAFTILGVLMVIYRRVIRKP